MEEKECGCEAHGLRLLAMCSDTLDRPTQTHPHRYCSGLASHCH